MWLLPSRNRPDRLRAALAAAVAAGLSTPGRVILDPDHDPEYLAIALPEGWAFLVMPERSFGSARAYEAGFRAFPHEPWYGLLTDDLIARTPGFDAALVAAAGAYGMASADDGWQARENVHEGRMHGATVIGGALVRAVGWLAPPGITHEYMDSVWETIGRDSGLWRSCMGVLTEHQHPANGRAPDDGVYAQARAARKDDRAAFELWVRTDRLQAARRANPAVEYGRTPMIVICTPSLSGTVRVEMAASLVEALTDLNLHGIQARWYTLPGDSQLNRVRAKLVAGALAIPGMTHLLWIDDDMEFGPDVPRQLLQAGHAIVGAAGRRKQEEPNYCVRLMEDADGTLGLHPESGCIVTDGIGTGMLLISRHALEQMCQAYPERKAAPVGGLSEVEQAWCYDFFPQPFEGGMWWGEDYSFCRLAKAVGFEAYVAPHLALGHIGTRSYRGRLGDELEPVATPPEPAAPSDMGIPISPAPALAAA